MAPNTTKVPEWIQMGVGAILIFTGTGVFTIAILAFIIVIFAGCNPSITGLIQYGIFLFVWFCIIGIGIKIHPKGRAWLNEGKPEKEKKEPKMMW